MSSRQPSLSKRTVTSHNALPVAELVEAHRTIKTKIPHGSRISYMPPRTLATLVPPSLRLGPSRLWPRVAKVRDGIHLTLDSNTQGNDNDDNIGKVSRIVDGSVFRVNIVLWRLYFLICHIETIIAF